jgi:hypothetical protein
MSELDIRDLGTVLPVEADAGMIVIRRSTVIKFVLPVVPAISVVLACILGLVVLTSLGVSSYLPEMTAAAVINALGGLMSVGALIMVAEKGAAAIARTAMAGTAIRIAGVLMGTLMAMGPGWGLQNKPLLYWVLNLYFVMLVAESWVAIWLVRRAKH